MGLLQPESLLWADQIENLEGQGRKEWRTKLKKAYDLSPSQITNLLAVKDCFDQPAIDKVRQAPFILSLNSALALAGLNGRVTDLPTAVHAALDVILARQLATKDIKKLVAWVISGKPASEFDPHQKPHPSALLALGQSNRGTRLEASSQMKTSINHDEPGKTSQSSNVDLKKIRQALEKAEAERIQGKETTAQDNLEALIRKIAGSSPSQDKSTEVGFSETILLDWLADISVIAQIKSKIKKGKPITKREVALLWIHKAGEIAGHVAKFTLKLFKPFFKALHWVWKLVVEALKELGLYKYAKAIFTLVGVAVAIWFAWEAFHYGLMRPVEMVWSKIHFNHVTEESPTPIPTPPSAPTPQPEVSTLMSLANSAMVHFKPKPTAIPTPTTVYQPSISFQPTVYDPKLLEQEIAAVPSHSLIKAYPLSPDETMPGDLAASRLQDLIDPDKYTMKLGSGTEKVLSVIPTTTNFTLNYKSTDVISFLGGSSGQLNFFWEDVKYIHSDEIDIEAKVPSVIYQCSLIVSDSKDALTIQCATADDLSHLVSTMEYFIRTSRLGHDTALAGMPYSFQGLRLTNECVVDKLWANSPADKSGVQWGDHLWSVVKATSDQQGKKVVEAGLQSLPITLFVVSPAEWTKAKIAQGPGSNDFRPKLRKVVLQL